jgi:hypothetical protein
MNQYILLNISLLLLLSMILAGCTNSGTSKKDISPKEKINATTPIVTPSDDERAVGIDQNPFADFSIEPDHVEEYEQTFYKKIAPDLTEYQFVLHGYCGIVEKIFAGTNEKYQFPVISIKRIDISETGGKLIQTIDSLNTLEKVKRLSDTDFSFDDWNHDGYMDISLFYMPGGSMANRPTYFWLWDNQIKQFVRNKELDEVSEESRITLEDDHRISAITKTGAQTCCICYYQFENGKLVLIEEHECNYS